MKKIINWFLNLIGNILGLSIFVRRRSDNSDILIIDKNIFSPFFQEEAEIKLYFEGLKKSNSEWSDNFYKQCRYYSLSQIIEHVSKQNKTDDVVECGVWNGHSAYMIAKTLKKNKFSGNFYIFDSFEGGLSDKSKEDRNLLREMTSHEILNEKNIFSSRMENVKKVLANFNFVKIYKCWIPEKFINVKSRRFSFVHIDVDLYKPTLDSLNFFWPRLRRNGFIVVDDYGSSQFPGATFAVDEFLKYHAVSFFYKVPMGACVIIK